jgi:uncharacterized cupredoxin-like copper-binding protein
MQTVPSLEYDMAEQQHRYLRPLLVAVLAPVLLIGCTRETPNGTPVDVTLKDFSITPATQTIRTGDVLLRASNEAPIIHEFIVVRTDLPPDRLPIGPDGLSVNEDWLSSMGEIEETPPGETGTLPLTLPPGHYVFFCNLEGHYLGGMHAVLQVTA